MSFQRFFFLLMASALAVSAGEFSDAYLIPEKRLFPYPAWFFWGIGCGIVLLLCLAGYLFWRWRRNRAVQAAIPPTPYEAATAALQALLAEGLPERGEVNLFHQRLSGILRQYLEERFRVSAPKLTTEEFLQLLTETPSMVREHRALLQNFLTACDMVKFACAEAAPAEMTALADSCSHFLENTREEIPAPGEKTP